jgi:hypothetical protein
MGIKIIRILAVVKERKISPSTLIVALSLAKAVSCSSSSRLFPRLCAKQTGCPL